MATASSPLIGVAGRYFLEVARTGSLTLAAEQLHVAASALSRQIAKLEEAVDCPLFERRARGMVLTAAGERLAAHLRSTSVETQRLLDGLRTDALDAARRVTVACTEGFAGGFMGEVMHRFRQWHPDCRIRCHMTTPEGVSGMVSRGEADVGLKFAVTPERGLHIEHQQPAPVTLIVAPGHPLSRRRRVSLRETARFPVGLPTPGTTLRQTLDLVFGMQGLRVDAACTGDLATLVDLVVRGELVMFSSMLSVSHLLSSERVLALPVPELQFYPRQLQVLTYEQSPPEGLQRAFVDRLIAAVMDHG